MKQFTLALIAALTALAALSLWSLTWVLWNQPSRLEHWMQAPSEGTMWVQVFVGFALLSFAKQCSNRAGASASQVLFIGVTGLWGLAALCAGMNLLPAAWLPSPPTSSQAISIFLAGCLSLAQAGRATATMNGEEGEDEEAAPTSPKATTPHT